MTLVRETDLGAITISNTIFSQIIFDGTMLPECKDNLWAATRRGRQVGIGGRFTDTDLAMNIDTEYDSDSSLRIEFNIIVRFGISIKQTSKVLADYIAENVEGLCGRKPSIITINIAGVKTKQNKVRRNTKVVYRYGA